MSRFMLARIAKSRDGWPDPGSMENRLETFEALRRLRSAHKALGDHTGALVGLELADRTAPGNGGILRYLG